MLSVCTSQTILCQNSFLREFKGFDYTNRVDEYHTIVRPDNKGYVVTSSAGAKTLIHYFNECDELVDFISLEVHNAMMFHLTDSALFFAGYEIGLNWTESIFRIDLNSMIVSKIVLSTINNGDTIHVGVHGYENDFSEGNNYTFNAILSIPGEDTKYIVKMNQKGEIEWSKEYAFPQMENPYLYTNLLDNGQIICANWTT